VPTRFEKMPRRMAGKKLAAARPNANATTSPTYASGKIPKRPAITTAIGIALARPDRPVFCVAGDGGFAMYAVELKLAAAERVPVCFVLMSDGRYGSIACAPQSHPMSERALSFRAPSWLETVASFGIAGARADSAADFARLVDAWDGAGPFFIECRFEALSYARMTENLR